jgi:hypothetical protein
VFSWNLKIEKSTQSMKVGWSKRERERERGKGKGKTERTSDPYKEVNNGDKPSRAHIFSSRPPLMAGMDRSCHHLGSDAPAWHIRFLRDQTRRLS